ncbi:MAG: 4Fe-4S binding protein [Candidatus Lokiarchaeota archaeon]|nr:4Fe-4S binding protein [Candidatus Lokiarchaeota archaeon]
MKICPLKIREFGLDGKAVTVGQCFGCNICTRKCPNNAIDLYVYQINR